MTDSARITRAAGRQVWDSRGRPTVEVEIHLAGGASGRGIAPAGASRGTREAVELRDGGERFGGHGVDRAVAMVNDRIAPRLIGRDARDPAAVDALLIADDGTDTKAVLGGNTTTAVSLAAWQAAAAAAGQPLWAYLAAGSDVTLPMPQVQIFGGGAHADRRVDIQDFLVIPVGATSVREALEMAERVYRAAGEVMKSRNRLAGTADEGGWWPAFDSNEQALETLTYSIERAGLRAGPDVAIALDVAASEFGHGGSYRLALEGQVLDRAEFRERLLGWIARFPIVSIEDPCSEDDLAGWHGFFAATGGRVQVIGDDLLVTRASLVREAARDRLCNSVLIKVNQRGTVSESLDAMNAARDVGFSTVVSARSGETEDVAIAHLATGWSAGQIKVGSFARSERMAKWNELLRIESTLGSRARFAGASVLAGLPRGVSER